MADKSQTTNECICQYCGRSAGWPCRNTRDMTDSAISGDDICYNNIKSLGGGEAGMRYIDLNRKIIR